MAAPNARRAAWWTLSPFAWGTALTAARSGCRVLAGPFAGMRYPAAFVPRMLFSGPYQVGSFELELHDALEAEIASAPEVVVNVGSAEGYYATGLAMRLSEARVIAFELDPALRDAARRLAERNGVAGRIELRGLCTPEALSALGPRLSGMRTLVLMDCEGAEAELADPSAVQWLAGVSMVIELHPAARPDVEALLATRLGESHDLELVSSRVRRASDFDSVLRPVRGLRRIDRELLVAEFRDGRQDWLLASPRSGD